MSSSPFEKALAEATSQAAADGNKDQSLQEQVDAALACPCLDELKAGPCGTSFIAAFKCFMLNQEEDKAQNCVDSFQTLHQCMVKHPQAFAEFVPQAAEQQQQQ
ncbi:hypothetical protein WJX72_009736 [[Myrmecia] bisecta]|uniref:GCK domain-containing protein n=1 Tax=[Myrmecia] bisecta TaxID=41462 RepID=A0AAW1Q1L0_9CHLO